jgi:hypothetical protein
MRFLQWFLQLSAAGTLPALSLCIDVELGSRARTAKGSSMKAQMIKYREKLEGRVLVPALLWMAGVPFGVVLLLWFFFFRGR